MIKIIIEGKERKVSVEVEEYSLEGLVRDAIIPALLGYGFSREVIKENLKYEE